MQEETNDSDSYREPLSEPVEKNSALHTVTPLSKYLAMALFIAMPFIGGWIGYHYAPTKVVEIERVVIQEGETPQGQTTSVEEVVTFCASGFEPEGHITNDGINIFSKGIPIASSSDFRVVGQLIVSPMDRRVVYVTDDKVFFGCEHREVDRLNADSVEIVGGWYIKDNSAVYRAYVSQSDLILDLQENINPINCVSGYEVGCSENGQIPY